MTPLRIWIVDDDHLYQNMLMSYLAILGYQARGFMSGEECLKHLNEQPDVVLLDHNLGEGMNGVDVLLQIKRQQLKTRIIYISGEDKVSLVSDTYQHGSEEYITKDTASLLRLKLRLEKIEMANELYRKKRRKKIILIGVVVVLSILSSGFYFFIG
jgi:DNA-binding NtrC family response regulator